MIARVITIKVRPERMDDCITTFRDVTGPSIARQEGFNHGHWWVDRTSGEAWSVTFWDTTEHEQASRANVSGLIKDLSDVLATHEVTQNIYEHVHDQFPSI